MLGGSFLFFCILAPVAANAASCSLGSAGKIVHRGEIFGALTSVSNSDTLSVDLAATAAYIPNNY